VSQEHKGQPLGKPALRLKYMATMKVRVAGYRAYCQGRAAGEPGSYYTVWEEGVLMTTNNV
ncbi:MAG: AAA family ATPase, partial [Prevotella sp.]|nr:AAA family ATPase [Prevotella sp.]